MPFRSYTNFTPEMLRKMTVAYDAAIATLGIQCDDPVTGRLAAKIAALAAEGEADPAKLCERAVAELHGRQTKKARQRPSIK